MGSIFGGGDLSGAASSAAAAQSAAAERAAQLQYQMYQEAVKREQPWVTVGGGGTPEQWSNVGGALGQLAGLYGVPGATAVDPTKTLQATPGYQWLLGQGTNARDLSAASRGMALSGAQQKGLTNYGQNLAQTYAWAPYISGLTNLSSGGQSGAALQGQQGLQTGQNMGQDFLASGQAQAQGIWNAALANAQGNQGWGQLLGMGLGAATSFLGGGGGLGSLFGGWGGGGGGSTFDINQMPSFQSSLVPNYNSGLPSWFGGSGYFQ